MAKMTCMDAMGILYREGAYAGLTPGLQRSYDEHIDNCEHCKPRADEHSRQKSLAKKGYTIRERVA